MSNLSKSDFDPPATPVPALPPARIRTRTRAMTTAGPMPVQAAPRAEAAPEQTGALPDYAVGYAKPPKATRFKPGQSGNPKGRPRAAKGLSTLVRQNLLEKVLVRTATGEKRISRIEAVLHKTVEQAMKGNPRALAELLKLYGNAVPDEKAGTSASTEHANDLTASDLATLEAYRNELRAEGTEQ